MEEATAPHVLVFPLPLQGHVSPMLKLAELLSLKGLSVTFLTTDHVLQRLRRSGCVDATLSRRPRLRLRSIPDGLPVDDPRPLGRVMEIFLSSLTTRSPQAYRELLQEEHDGRPPVTCAIVDGFLPFAGEVAEELGIPTIACRTSAPCSFWAYYCIPKLIEEGEVPFPEGGGNMDELVRGVPGMESFLRRRDLPSPCRSKDPNEPSLVSTASVTRWTPRARGLIFNTVEPLDAAVLAHIRRHCPVTYTVGPLHDLVELSDPAGKARHVGSPATAPAGLLWPEDRTCMAWLDAQPTKSVVYVSFGSLTVLSRAQLLEFWHGLMDSGHRFLWAIRPDLLMEEGMVAGGEGGIPAEVREGTTEEKGRLVGWAPQRQVLEHPAVGAFLTHSGWNSMLESICAGVPMVCWPFFFDQMVNSRYASEVWRVGVDMKDTCDRATVARSVREVMEGESAEELRRNVSAWANTVRGCVEEDGPSSSLVSLDKLIQDIRSMSFQGLP